ncbi:MAG TPA: hypothetical protein VJS92_15085, partial [Candidatus Polarisedimenticolaceae bacterium]|nr:hypothetical protein [Candidatus Polarisedimenticolaceae bacterium]
VSALFLLRSPGVDDPAAYWLPLDDALEAHRAEGVSPDEDAYARAVEAYRRHDPAEVVSILHDRALPESADPLKLLLASALLKTGDAAGARATLEELLVVTLPQPYRDRASWILAGALRGEGRAAEAQAILRQLAAEPGELQDAARRAQGKPTSENPAQ